MIEYKLLLSRWLIGFVLVEWTRVGRAESKSTFQLFQFWMAYRNCDDEVLTFCGYAFAAG